MRTIVPLALSLIAAVSGADLAHGTCPKGGSGTWNDPSGSYSGRWDLTITACENSGIRATVVTHDSNQCTEPYPVAGELRNGAIHNYRATTAACGAWTAPRPIPIGAAAFSLNSEWFGDGVSITDFTWEDSR
jgi:hypothetical protein